jgi:hypothetical protein
VYRSDELLIHVVIASVLVLQLRQDQHKYEFACSRSLTRTQGYRIKRLSACGGCLGDHRR